MKLQKIFFLSALTFLCLLNNSILAQNWALMNGNCTPTLNPTYGTMGIPSASTNPGGRESGCSFTDAAGNFWLFGGYDMKFPNLGGYLGDLWKYNVSTNQWTWMKGSNLYNQTAVYGTMGIPSASNEPGSRFGSMGWTDLNGDFWLFGGQISAAASGPFYSNDLWKYTVSTGQWTWVSGTSNINDPGVYGTLGVPSSTVYPAARMGSATWVDMSGKLWLFGGSGFGTNSYWTNDLWKYDPATNQWTWVKGSNSPNVVNAYGAIGVPSVTNNPCSRGEYPATWVDNAGGLWMYGGLGSPAPSSGSFNCNDLWKFNIGTNEWTCINALSSQTTGLNPMGRISSRTWKNSNGDLFLFGGVTPWGTRNDVWRYNITLDQWLSVTPNYTAASCYSYNIASPQANPPTMQYSFSWVDKCGNFWVHGGETQYGSQNYPNSLWKLNTAGVINTNSTLPQHVCNGQTATVNVSSSGIVNWYTSSTSTNAFHTGLTYTLGPLTSTTVLLYVESPTCTLSPTRTEIMVVAAVPGITITGNNGVCIGSSVTQTLTGLNSFTWSTGSTWSTVSLTPTINTTYSVSGTDIYGCYGSANKTIVIYGLPTLSIVGPDTICKNYPAIVTAGGANTYSWNNGASGASMTVTPINNTTYTVTGTSVDGCKSKLTHTIIVKPTPAIYINSGAICAGKVFTLQVTSSIPYTLSSASQTVSPLSTTIYSAMNTGTNGCVGIALSTVVVHPLPTISVNNGTMCQGTSYTIFPSGAGTFTFSSGSPVVTLTATSVYTISGTSSFGCVSSSPATVQVTYFPNPIITANDTAVCTGEPYVAQGYGAATYWFTSGGNTRYPTSNTVYSIYGISNAGCYSAPVSFSVSVLPLPVVSISTSDSIICEGEEVTLTAYGASVYNWSTGHNTNSILIQPANNNTFTVVGVDTNGCSGSQTYLQLAEVCLSISKQTAQEPKLYPNPATNKFFVEPGTFRNNSDLKIFNQFGQMVLSRSIDETKNSIPIDGFQKGIYTVLFFESDNSLRAIRLIVE